MPSALFEAVNTVGSIIKSPVTIHSPLEFSLGTTPEHAVASAGSVATSILLISYQANKPTQPPSAGGLESPVTELTVGLGRGASEKQH